MKEASAEPSPSGQPTCSTSFSGRDLRLSLRRYTAGGDIGALRSVAVAAERACACGAPRAAFIFRGGSALTLPELKSPCFGQTSLSMWIWLRLDARPVDSPLQVVCALHGSGTSIEVVVRGGGVVGARVATPKGGVQMLEALSPLDAGRWHLLIVDQTAPPRRLFPFGRSPSSGNVRLYVDGACVLDGPLDFPSPTSALRYCSVGASAAAGNGSGGGGGGAGGGGGVTESTAASEALEGQLGELLLLPSASGPEAAADAARLMRVEPRGTLHETALRCGLRPSLSLHPSALSLAGASSAMPTTTPTSQLGVGEADAATHASAPRSAVYIERRRDVRHSLLAVLPIAPDCF